MKLLLLSPTKVVFDGEVESVTVPGTQGSFTVWENHAALISTLERGLVSCRGVDGEISFEVDGGFVEVRNNEVSICVEKLL